MSTSRPKFSAAPFPLDRMRLDADGKWHSVKGKDDFVPSGYVKVSGAVPPEPESYVHGLIRNSRSSVADNNAPIKPWCDHNWVDAGFSFTKLVCSKCDVEKP
jgi:hypothetical protein